MSAPDDLAASYLTEEDFDSARRALDQFFRSFPWPSDEQPFLPGTLIFACEQRGIPRAVTEALFLRLEDEGVFRPVAVPGSPFGVGGPRESLRALERDSLPYDFRDIYDPGGPGPSARPLPAPPPTTLHYAVNFRDWQEYIVRTRRAPEECLPLATGSPRPDPLGGGALPSPDVYDAKDRDILRALADQAPRLLLNYDIEAATQISRRTIGRRLARLIRTKLACGPNGPRSGTTVTDRGRHVAEASGQ